MELSNSCQKDLVSIVVPISHRPDLVRVCLDSIVNYTSENYELILVCDGVNKPEFDFLSNYKATIIYNKERLGFPKSVNLGFYEAKGEFIMELNSDTVVTPGWLTEMIKLFKSDSSFGLVVPTFTESSGIQSVDLNKKDEAYTIIEDGTSIKGVCLLFKRDTLLKVGILDERFGLGGGEDSDIAVRTMQGGFKIVVARRSYVYHYSSASFRELFNNDIPYSKKYSASVFDIFKKKHREYLNHKPRVYIAIPNNGFIHSELVIRLIEWSHDPEVVLHLHLPSGLSPLDSARNTCVKDFLEDYYDYLLFIDNDIVPPPNALRELLAADKDIIAPLCFLWQRDDKNQGFPLPVAHRYAENGEYKPHYGKGIEETDVVTGGMFLVKREVYEKMDRPFAFTYHANGTVILSEDFYFSQQAQKLGYKLYTHYGLLCKHYKIVDIKEINNLMVHYG